jgi:hypothetical protein
MFGMFVFWGWVVYMIIAWRKMRHKSIMQHKIIDKFNTAPELHKFVQSETGNKFMNFISINGLGIKEKLLASITRGLVLIFLGISFFLVGPMILDEVSEAAITLKTLGVVSIALGIAFLVSVFVSYKLSVKWEMFNRE